MSAVTEAAGRIDLRGRRDGRIKDVSFQALALAALLVSLGILVVLLWDLMSAAMPVFSERGFDFLRDPISARASRTGLWQALIGSLQIAVLTMLIAFPLGIATAVYLEEYSTGSRFTRIVDINIRNLAGVPSVVYGLLGFAIFVRLLGPRDFGGILDVTGGRTALAAGLTMGLLALPIVVITAAEAIRAVPDSLRQGGYGLGGTRWQVTSRLVLPSAMPGILTGMILSLARAIGETAPLIVIGAAAGGLARDPGLVSSLRESFTALPVMVFQWAKQPQREFVNDLTPAAIIVLLAFTLSLNGLAIFLRNRFEKRS